MFALDKKRDIWLYGFEDIDKQVLRLEYQESQKEANRFNGVIDENLNYNTESALKSNLWASLSDKIAIDKKIDLIRQKYLFDDSTSQVCISRHMIERTTKRIALLHLYGPETFGKYLFFCYLFILLTVNGWIAALQCILASFN